MNENNNLIRLNKYLSDCGYCSRREADSLIESKIVFVNNREAKVGDKINPTEDYIKIHGKKIIQQEYVYYAFNKPKGIVTTSHDEFERKNVTDFFPKNPRIYPIGRLDKDSEGLILLTNDGELTQKLTHPSFEHKKKYKMQVRNRQSNEKIDKNHIVKSFLNGIMVDNHLMKADKIEIKEINVNTYLFNVTLHTGYNRQLRKMCDKMDLSVITLERTEIGKISLPKLNLKPGEYKKIRLEDIL